MLIHREAWISGPLISNIDCHLTVTGRRTSRSLGMFDTDPDWTRLRRCVNELSIHI